MFAFLDGAFVHKSPSLIQILIGGIGYEVHISLQTYAKIQHLEKGKLYIHLQIKEDAWTLYGFADEEEKATFKALLGINGVGASTARIILSSLKPEELEHAIDTEDVKALERVKGIGAKTAQRIILELKGKLVIEKKSTQNRAEKHNTIEEDALLALVNLGIPKANAEAALRKTDKKAGQSIEELIKLALKAL